MGSLSNFPSPCPVFQCHSKVVETSGARIGRWVLSFSSSSSLRPMTLRGWRAINNPILGLSPSGHRILSRRLDSCTIFAADVPDFLPSVGTKKPEDKPIGPSIYVTELDPFKHSEYFGPLLELGQEESTPLPALLTDTEKLPASRPKRPWTGPRRVRRLPPQPPWTEDECRQRVKVILRELLAIKREDLGLWSIANVLDAWVGKITRVDLSGVVKELGYQQKGALALRVFKWMQNQKRRLKPNGHSYSLILGVLGRASMECEARDVFESMLSSDVKVSVHQYNAMVAVYARCGDFKTAWQMYEDMANQGIHADEITFNTLLSGVGRAGLPAVKAEQLFLRFKQKGFCPSVQSYNTLISLFSEGRHLERASSLVHEMKAMDTMPDLCTFNTLLSMYARAGKPKEALEVMHSLRAVGLEPNTVTYTGLIQAFSCAHNHDEAISTFLEMQGAGCTPDLTTYSLMVHVYGKAGLLEEAGQVFKQMQAAGFEPNVVAWSSLIQAYGRQGMFEETGTFFNEMLVAQCQPDVTLYNTLMGASGREGLVVQAANFFRKMQASGIIPNAISYNTMIQAYSQAGQPEEAQRVYDQMTQAGFSPDKISKAVHSSRVRRIRHPKAVGSS